MRKLVATFCLLFTALTVQANEADVHLRVMAHLLRATGFSDAAAKYLALSNQYVDMNAMSSAMLTPAQRQLWHFPGSLDKVNVEGHGPLGLLQRMGETNLALASRNHALANYLIYDGLKNGDLQKVGFGFHVKVDGTGAHVGYSNLFGHLVDGHNPDRVFLEPGKFENMVRSIVQSLIAVRHMMPAELQDKEAALRYFNTFAKDTYLQRDLTMADMNDPVILSSLILKDKTMQKIAREDMFKKYEYKLLALNKIYNSFRKRGIIKAELTRAQVFPDALIRNTNLDVTDIVRLTAINYIEAMVAGDKKSLEVFDLHKLIRSSSSVTFHMKLDVERRRFLERLKDYRFEFNKIKAAQMSEVFVSEIELEKRMHTEAQALLIGVDQDINEFLAKDANLEKQAEKLSHHRVAEDFAMQLTKDFVPVDPRKYNEYVKQNFEGETENRKFEVKYKDEAYRRYYAHVWGTNWVLDERTMFDRFKEAAIAFKNRIFGIKNIEAQKEMWERLADKAAEKLFEGVYTPSAELAQKIRFNFKNEVNAMIKMAAYTLPAIPLFFGYRYVQKILRRAEAHAKDHEIENMEKAKENGKYKMFSERGKSKSALDNIQQIRRESRLQCVYLFQ